MTFNEKVKTMKKTLAKNERVEYPFMTLTLEECYKAYEKGVSIHKEPIKIKGLYSNWLVDCIVAESEV